MSEDPPDLRKLFQKKEGHDELLKALVEYNPTAEVRTTGDAERPAELYLPRYGLHDTNTYRLTEKEITDIIARLQKILYDVRKARGECQCYGMLSHSEECPHWEMCL